MDEIGEERGHVFVALNNSFQISADAWCLGGTAWWQDFDLTRTGSYAFSNDQIMEIREEIEYTGPRETEIRTKMAFFGKGCVTDLPVPRSPDPGFSRVAVMGRGTTTCECPPVGVFTSVRVPMPVRQQGEEMMLDWLMTSLEEYLVAAARWLASPRDDVARAIWEAAQLNQDAAWQGLCPNGENLTEATLVQRVRDAMCASDMYAVGLAEALTLERALQMLGSLTFSEGRRQVDGATLLSERGEAGITLGELQQAIYRGEPPRARRKCHLLTAPVLGTGAGGAKSQAGRVVERIMVQLLSATAGRHYLWPKRLDEAPMLADVVLVCPDKQIFSMAQSWRLLNLDKCFPVGGVSPYPSKHRSLIDKAQWLGRQASGGRLAVFIGAGVSAGAGLPSWFAVLEMVERDVEDLFEEHTGQRPQLKMGERTADDDGSWNPFNFATGLEEELRGVPPPLFRSRFPAPASGGPDEPDATQMMKELVCSHLGSRFHSLNHALLAGMPVDKMVTQNYDNLLEQASNSVDMFNPTRPYRYATLSVLPLDAKAESGRWLLKMHGTLTYPESIVITSKDYEEYDSKSQALAGLVQGTMLTCHMFFIGFSGVDINYKKILKAVKQAKPAKDRVGMATLLKIVDEGEQDDDTSVDRVLFDEDGSIPTGARMQEIFVDLVSLHAKAASPKMILDPRVESALSEDELWLKGQCEHFASYLDQASEAVRSTPTYAKVMQMFEELGRPQAESQASKTMERTMNVFEKMRCAMDVMDEDSLRLLLAVAQDCMRDGLDSGDLPRIADFAFKKSSEQQVRDVFKKYDTNGDGTISLAELAHTLQKLDSRWTQQSVEKLLQGVDSDGSGKLSFQEFLNWISGD